MDRTTVGLDDLDRGRVQRHDDAAHVAHGEIVTDTHDAEASSLDIAVRARLSSPKADPGILLVDIDERSLAALSPKYGRWPWPRSVLAEGLAGLSGAGAKSVALNVMLSDPDTAHPEDDAAFDDVAARTSNLAFPITRLDTANDAKSEVAITAFAGAKVTAQQAAVRVEKANTAFRASQ